MVDKLLYDLIPPGIICLWSGAIIDIPEDWAICDGTNQTPDLRDRFVIGAGGSKTVDAFGGSDSIDGVINHTHGITINEVEHNHTQNPHLHIQDAHTHTQNSHNHIQDSHNHTQNSHNHTQDAHSHVVTSQTATTGSATSYEHGTLDTSSAEAEATETTATAVATNQAATATNQAATATNQSATAVNQTSTAVNQNATATNNPASTGITASSADPAGGVASIDITPPFYALAYIMKRWTV